MKIVIRDNVFECLECGTALMFWAEAGFCPKCNPVIMRRADYPNPPARPKPEAGAR